VVWILLPFLENMGTSPVVKAIEASENVEITKQIFWKVCMDITLDFNSK
jgi:hypothetical protein